MAELTTNATGDTWHEAVQAAVDEAVELLGEAEVWSVEVEPITTLRIYSQEPKVAWYRATVTSRPKGCGYATNEAKQREEAEPDPMDENDHRDRVDPDGDRWVHTSRGCWHIAPASCIGDDCRFTLTYISECYGPLAFAPDADGAPGVTAPAADDPAPPPAAGDATPTPHAQHWRLP